MKTIVEIAKELRAELGGLEAAARGEIGQAVVATGVCEQPGATSVSDGNLIRLWSKGIDVDLHGDHAAIQKMWGKYSVTVIFRKID